MPSQRLEPPSEAVARLREDQRKASALLAEDGAALTAGGQPEEARHRGESRNPQGVLDGNANPAPAVSAEDGAA